MISNTILCVYIVLLLVGGLFGYYKAGSKVSLVTAAVTAGLLVFTLIPGLLQVRAAHKIQDVILGVLIVVFAIRLTKTKKFMPSGLMLSLTVGALVLKLVFA